jgi:hypothetical protein
MRKFCVIGGLVVGLLAYATVAGAAPTIGGQNWADSVENYTGNIQNFGGTMMDVSTEWWVTGKSDADADGNDYAFDPGDPDNVAGWRIPGSGEYITVKFDTGLADVDGNDLVIRMYCGPKANASVLASTDGISYTEIGSIVGKKDHIPGMTGCLYDAEFDFNPFGLDGVQYVKVDRVSYEPKSGMFFDSFASTAVPEPTTLVLLALGCLLMAARWTVVRRRRAVARCVFTAG